MKTVKTIMAVALLLMNSAVFSQQETSFTTYRHHMNIINPAYAGIDNETLLVSTLRDQWTGVKDAPIAQAVSFGTPVGKNTGLGLSFVSDQTFVEKQTFVSVDVSYKIQINPALDLYFGLKAGGNFYSVNTSGLETYNIQSDPALASYSSFTPNIGLGLVLKSENYYVSFSVPKILSNDRAKTDAGYAVLAKDRSHFYLSGGYDIDISSNATMFIFRPSVMMRYVKEAPVSIDFTAMFEIEKIFSIGTMYRTDQAFGIITDFTLNKRLLIGYSYEWSTRSILGSDNNTYELLLKYKF
jgi:type IX secretion system PorP/SprF family membrane protein